MAITRRSFLAGLGSVSVGLLFHRQLDRVLESLERDLVDEPTAPNQAPSAAEIVVQTQSTFRPARLVVPLLTVPLFVIEDIQIAGQPQFAAGTSVPAEFFTPGAHDSGLTLDAVTPGMELRFRVRYVGTDPQGARFDAALFGSDTYGSMCVLPISSGCAITA